MRLWRKSMLFFVSVFALFIASGATIAQNAGGSPPQNGDNRLIDLQSASGKITAIKDDTLTIEIEHVRPPGEQFLQEDQPSAMTFLINSSTKVEGKLEVGSNADVLYHEKDGKNVAVSVKVTAVS